MALMNQGNSAHSIADRDENSVPEPWNFRVNRFSSRDEHEVIQIVSFGVLQ
jgi:hypothetical protein